MKKNFYLIEAYVLSHIAFFMFGRYFHSPALYFDVKFDSLLYDKSETCKSPSMSFSNEINNTKSNTSVIGFSIMSPM